MNPKKMLCNCKGLTYGKIMEAVEQGDRTFEEVQQRTGLSAGCGRCRDFAEYFVRELVREKEEKRNG